MSTPSYGSTGVWSLAPVQNDMKIDGKRGRIDLDSSGESDLVYVKRASWESDTEYVGEMDELKAMLTTVITEVRELKNEIRSKEEKWQKERRIGINYRKRDH